MLSCTAISNPAPGKFAWYRRNGSELLEIHPSINSDHSLFVAISQDYDYASDSSGSLFDYYHQQHYHVKILIVNVNLEIINESITNSIIIIIIINNNNNNNIFDNNINIDHHIIDYIHINWNVLQVQVRLIIVMVQ